MSRFSPRPVDYLLLVAISAIWGSSFLFIKLAVAEIPPMTLVAARLILAAAAMLLFLWSTGRRLPRGLAVWRDFSVIAVVGNIVPFYLISWGEETIDVGLTAILMATMPLASLVLAHIFTHDDRLSVTKIAGMALGFGGILMLVGPGALAGLGRDVLAQLAVAAAATCYAISNVYTRRSSINELPAAVTSAGILVSSAVLCLPFSLVMDRPWTLNPSLESLLALLVLALLCTAAAYLILYRLLSTTRVTFVALLNFQVPVFGVVFGALFLGEVLQLNALIALGLILSGIALAQFQRGRGTSTPILPES